MSIDPALAALPYRVGPCVGSGGGGDVHQAWTADGACVALKVTHGADERAAALAAREVACARRLPGPHFPTVLAAGQLDDGRTWLAMEWLPGGTLADRLSDRPVSVPAVARLGAELARALAAAHAVGIVHRDLKPANVMFRSDGRAVLVDLGLARGTDDPASSATCCAGTPLSMAPEQVLGDPIGPATDLYALGALLYRLRAGHDPFSGSALELQLAHLGQEPPPLPATAERGADALTGLIGELMRKRPGDRPSSATTVARRLAAIARPSWRGAPGRVAAVAALALAAVATLALTPGTAPWPTLAAPAIAAPAAPTIASQPWVVADTDDYTLRASWTDGARAGDRLKVQVEIWDDAGAALPLAGLAGALRDPDGHSVGVTGAALRALELPLAGVGDYVLTVFAPDGDVTLAVTIPVGPPPQS